MFSPAHSNVNLAEIVCSNSFKSNLTTNACGLLKEELRQLDSLLIKCADETKVPAGQALAVDREAFSKLVSKRIEGNKNIEVIREEFTGDIEEDGITIIATGPLTSAKMAEFISKLTGKDRLFFYDAAAPIIEKDSIDMNIAFYGDRYGKTGDSSYINLPMNKEEYELFYNELVNAEVVELHNFEKKEIFEGCMPVEVMAKRGIDTMRFGMLKPVGFTDPRTGVRPYALVQLRQDNSEGNLYNMVGFQTNLKFGEQKRVFSLIPGLKNAEFVKYGVMHRNTYINSPELLDNTYNLKGNKNIYFAGQITGVEGYVESIASGMVAALNSIIDFKNCRAEHCSSAQRRNNQSSSGAQCAPLYEKQNKIIFPRETIIGALADYISTPNKNFQPMNANFGILPELEEKIKDKHVRYEKLADKSLQNMTKIIQNNDIFMKK